MLPSLMQLVAAASPHPAVLAAVRLQARWALAQALSRVVLRVLL